MEIKYKLDKPYTEDERRDFIFYYGQNCKQELPTCYVIKETETELQAWGYTKEEIEEQKRERIKMLSLTKREVFLAIYKDKQITPEQIRGMITSEEGKIEFDYANDYFRGNPLIDQLGLALGYTSDDLDYLFQNKEFPVHTEEELIEA